MACPKSWVHKLVRCFNEGGYEALVPGTKDSPQPLAHPKRDQDRIIMLREQLREVRGPGRRVGRRRPWRAGRW